MSRQGLRDRWRCEVYRNKQISEPCRVLLLLLADNMTDAGRVSTPRTILAAQLDVHTRRVTARITEACRAGLLAKAGGGFSGATAQYEALLPEKVADMRPPKGGCSASTNSSDGGGSASTFLRPPLKNSNPTQHPGKVAAVRPPNARASVNEPRQSNDVETNDRDQRNDDVTELRIDKEPPTNPPVDALSLLPDINRNCIHCQRAFVASGACLVHGTSYEKVS